MSFLSLNLTKSTITGAMHMDQVPAGVSQCSSIIHGRCCLVCVSYILLVQSLLYREHQALTRANGCGIHCKQQSDPNARPALIWLYGTRIYTWHDQDDGCLAPSVCWGGTERKTLQKGSLLTTRWQKIRVSDHCGRQEEDGSRPHTKVKGKGDLGE